MRRLQICDYQETGHVACAIKYIYNDKDFWKYQKLVETCSCEMGGRGHFAT